MSRLMKSHHGCCQRVRSYSAACLKRFLPSSITARASRGLVSVRQWRLYARVKSVFTMGQHPVQRGSYFISALKRNGIMVVISLCLIFMGDSALCYGDVNGSLGNFFSSLGYVGNATSSHAYEDQSAGYYSGGGLFLRNQVQDIQLIHVDAPSLTAGCGGIDAYLGAFSFIKLPRIVAVGKKILAGVPGYTFQLALETAVPEMAHTLQTVQSWMQKINSLNINSCHAGEALVGGLWPKMRGSQQQICQDLGQQNNTFADWAAARQGCSTGGQEGSVLNEAAKNPQYKNQVVRNKNLMWSILMQNAFLANDDQLAELFMSLTGTLIFDKQGKPTYYPSLLDDRSLIKALLHGGKAPILACDNTGADQCLNIKNDTISIDQNRALDKQVHQMIVGLINAVQSDSGITDQQKGFVNATSIPVMKYITVASSLKMGQGLVDINQYADVIAEDILAQYLKEALEVAKASLQEAGQFPAGIQQQLQQNIETAQAQVDHMQQGAFQKIQNTMGLVRNIAFLQKQVSGALSSQFADNLKFEGEN